MTDILIGLPVVCLVAALLGYGWACVLGRVGPPGPLGTLFRAWLCAIAITSIAWAWAYPAGLSVRWALLLQVGIALAGYAVAAQQRAFGVSRIRFTKREALLLLLSFILAAITLLPAVASVTRLSLGLRVGPDSVGYAISVHAIEQGLTRPEIRHALFAQTADRSIGQIVSPVTKLVDSTPSFTTQVQGEFLEGADRWGFAGAAGSALYVIGIGHLWSLLSLLAGFGVLTTGIGLTALVVERTERRRGALLAVVLLFFSPSLLNAWHEGGLGQMWVMPATLALAMSVLRSDEDSRWPSMLLAALGTATVLPAYNSDLITYGGFLAIAAAVSLLVRRRRWLASWSAIAAGVGIGAVAVLPAALAFVQTLARDLSENSAAGWFQPHWLSLGEAFGLISPYGTELPQLTARTATDLLFDGLASLVVLVFVLSLVRRRSSRSALVLLATTLLLGVAVYVKTRYADHASNYQYFKTIPTLAPAGCLALGILYSESAFSPQATSRRYASFLDRFRRIAVQSTSVIVIGAVIAAGVTYVVSYRSQAAQVPSAVASLAGSPAANAAFDEYNIVGQALLSPAFSQTTLATYSLGAEINLNFIGRSYGSPPTRLGERVKSPVTLIVFSQQCPGFTCIASVPKSAIVFHNDALELVKLSDSTVALSQLPEMEWSAWAYTRFTRLGGTLPGLLSSGYPA